jgi:hypothetical protein
MAMKRLRRRENASQRKRLMERLLRKMGSDQTVKL